MKPLPLVLATMLVATAFVPAGAAATSKAPEQVAAMPAASDMSAARKSKPKKRRVVRVYPYYYEPVYVRPRWGFADPSFTNQGEIQFRRSIGQCVIDLGYGRWESCSVGGPN